MSAELLIFFSVVLWHNLPGLVWKKLWGGLIFLLICNLSWKALFLLGGCDNIGLKLFLFAIDFLGVMECQGRVYAWPNWSFVQNFLLFAEVAKEVARWWSGASEVTGDVGSSLDRRLHGKNLRWSTRGRNFCSLGCLSSLFCFCNEGERFGLSVWKFSLVRLVNR